MFTLMSEHFFDTKTFLQGKIHHLKTVDFAQNLKFPIFQIYLLIYDDELSSEHSDFCVKNNLHAKYSEINLSKAEGIRTSSFYQ